MPLYLLIINFVQIIARFVVGVQSIRLAKEKKMNNFYWLAGYFLIFCVIDISMTLFNGFGLGAVFSSPAVAGTVSYVLRKGLYMVGDLFLVWFVYKTFYQGRKSPLPFFFMGLSIVWGVLSLVLFFIPKPVSIPSDFVTFIWFAVEAFLAYRGIAGDKMVEDWVKGRYVLLVAGNILFCASAVDTIISIIQTGKVGAFSPITNFAMIGAVILVYLAWMMPGFFRAWLNRKYQQAPAIVEMSEEDLQRELGKYAA